MFKLVLKWVIYALQIEGGHCWFKQIKPILVWELKLFGIVFVQNKIYIQYCIYISTFAQIKSVKIIHFEGWRNNELHHSCKGDWKSSKIQM